MGKVIAIVSGKGGVGKSSICATLAYCLAELEKKVLLVDMDKGLRTLDILMNVAETTLFDLGDVLDGECLISDAVYKAVTARAVEIISAPAGAEYNFDILKLKALCGKLSDCYDFVLLDSPAGLGDGFRAAIAPAESVLLVTTPDPVCARDARQTSLETSKLCPGSQRLIINRIKKDPFVYDDINSLDDIIDITEVQLLGIVYEDGNFINSLLSGKLPDIESEAKQAVMRIAKRLCGVRVKEKMRY